MKLRSVFPVKRIEKAKNIEFCERCDENVKESIVRWSGHIERLDSIGRVKNMAEGDFGGQRRGRPERRWYSMITGSDCVRIVYSNRIEEAKELVIEERVEEICLECMRTANSVLIWQSMEWLLTPWLIVMTH